MAQTRFDIFFKKIVFLCCFLNPCGTSNKGNNILLRKRKKDLNGAKRDYHKNLTIDFDINKTVLSLSKTFFFRNLTSLHFFLSFSRECGRIVRVFQHWSIHTQNLRAPCNPLNGCTRIPSDGPLSLWSLYKGRIPHFDKERVTVVRPLRRGLGREW